MARNSLSLLLFVAVLIRFGVYLRGTYGIVYGHLAENSSGAPAPPWRRLYGALPS